MANKAGETVKVELTQTDAAGEVISYSMTEWYGNENPDANVMSMSLVSAVAQVADGWRVSKKEGKKLAGNS